MDKSKLYKLLNIPKDFFKYWDKEIWCEDNRTKSMPSMFKGTVIGIQLDKVLLRSNNNITAWYPLNNNHVSFMITE